MHSSGGLLAKDSVWPLPRQSLDWPRAGTGRPEQHVLLTVGLGEILVQLGVTPVTAALPTLVSALSVPTSAGAWILTTFLLPLASFLLLAGRLGDLLGRRRLFLVGTGVYALGALASGLADGLLPLLLARAAQGLGAALISGNNLALLTASVAPSQRGRAIGLVATLSSVSAVAGIGAGSLAAGVGEWRWIFFGCLPLAALALWCGWRLPTDDAGRHRTASVDGIGAACLVVALGSVALALGHPHGATTDGLMPAFHLGLPVLAVGALMLFWERERTIGHPLFDVRALGTTAFAAPIAINTILHGTMMGAMFLGPILVSSGLGLGAAPSGIFLLVVQSGAVLTARLGGSLFDRGWPHLRRAAALLMALGLLGMGPAALLGNYVLLLAAALVAGAGMGCLLAANNTVVMSAVRDDQRGVASGMLETTRQLAHGAGVALPAAFLTLLTSAGQTHAAVTTAFGWSTVGMGILALGCMALAAPARSQIRHVP